MSQIIGCRGNFRSSTLCGSFGRLNCPLRSSVPVVARSYPQRGPSRIIIPGDRQGSNSQTNKIVLPGQGRGQSSALIDTKGVPAPSTTQFRPPPGFMDTADPLSHAARPLEQGQAQEALDRLRATAGHWHELAQLLPGLSAAGYDSTVIEHETGLERALQSIWAVAQQVHDSLKKSGKLAEEELEYFNEPEGANTLYHLRFLPVTARPAVATYIVEQQFNATESNVLARAVKEQERREGEKEGFTRSPADCLAYKYYRDAVESRNEEERKQLVQKGLSIAQTASAIATLEGFLVEKPESVVGTAEAQEATLEIVRLTGDEVEFRPVPLLGEMAETSASVVAAAVGVRQSGPYNAFGIPAETVGQQFVALPAFRSLLLARSPVALSIADCAKIPAILKSAKAKSEEDKRRHSGPGLVLLNRHLEEDSRAADSFYVKEKGNGCELVPGHTLGEKDEVVGRVLFICRPPARTAEARLDSYALMSV